MTVLDDIIDGSTDPAVSTADLLRRVKIVAHRLQATDVISWVDNELTGYAADAALPDYRIRNASVIATYAGYFQSFKHYALAAIPKGMESLWKAEMRQSIGEIQGLAELDEDPGVDWSPMDLERYERSGVFYIEDHSLYAARTVISRQNLRGMIDVVRTRALELALELQAASPDAGSVGGPTVASPELSGAVFNITQNIYGDGNNVAAGHSISQKGRVSVGDEQALRREVTALGLADADVEEFVTAVIEEQSTDGPKVRRFIDRLKSGSLALTGNVASNVAASGLIELASSFLGL